MRWTKYWKRNAKRASLVRSQVRLSLLLVLILPGAAVSQEPTIRAQTNVVVIPALVKNAKGEIVYGLAAKDFVVEDDGVELPARLEEVAEGQQISLVLAVQTGRRADYEFPRMRGLSSMLDPLLESGLTRVAVVEFDSEPQLIQDFSSNPEETKRTLKNLQPGNEGAAIVDAIDYSIKLLKNAPQQRQRVLLLVSETRDHGSHAVKMNDVVAEIGQSDTAVYALAFAPSRSNILDTMRGNNLDEMNPAPDLLAPIVMAAQAMKKNTPKTVASMTGGEYELFASQKSFDARMIDFTNHLHSRYVLNIEPKNPHPGLHRISVGLRDPRDRRVLARTSYWALSPEK